MGPGVHDLGDVRELSEFRIALDLSRDMMRDARKNSDQRHTLAAQQDYLAALEGYVAELTRLGLPAPYDVRNELNVYRQLCGIRQR